jgi:hypothetical protein
VLSEQGSLSLTLDDVNQLVADGELNRVQGLLLSAPLQLAQRHFEAERNRPGVWALNRFIRRRDFFIERGVLRTDEQVEPCFYIPDLIVEGWVPPPD